MVSCPGADHICGRKVRNVYVDFLLIGLAPDYAGVQEWAIPPSSPCPIRVWRGEYKKGKGRFVGIKPRGRVPQAHIPTELYGAVGKKKGGCAPSTQIPHVACGKIDVAAVRVASRLRRTVSQALVSKRENLRKTRTMGRRTHCSRDIRGDRGVPECVILKVVPTLTMSSVHRDLAREP